ncbi:MAG: putative propionate kinase [Chlamydiae bacterium]|nr:putative propionate kinase [Chlamydiota bacterium]
MFLCFNCGSSSIKFTLFDSKSLKEIVEGEITQLNLPTSHVVLKQGKKTLFSKTRHYANKNQAIDEIFVLVKPFGKITKTGHRIVHGGLFFSKPVRVNRALFKKMQGLEKLAPLHMPLQLSVLKKVLQKEPKMKHIVIFDTGFFHAIPAFFKRLPMSKEVYKLGIQKFGFHGISYESVLHQLKNPKDKMVVAHIGGGVSVTAIDKAKPVDTTMEFSPTSGVIMGTRSGSIDPTVIFYLAREKKWPMEKIDHMLNFESGLLGLSEKSSDMVALLKQKDKQTKEAVERFCLSIAHAIAKHVVTLGGIKRLVFTASIGFYSDVIREKICHYLKCLGVELDAKKNKSNAPIVSSKKSKVIVQIVKTDENKIIAQHTKRL